MFGSKDEREVITKTQIAKKLQKGLRADIISMTVVWALVIVVFICMYSKVGNVISWAIVIVFSVAIAYATWKSVRDFVALSRGRFTVSEDKFGRVDVCPKPRSRRSRYSKFQYVFLFASGKIYIIDTDVNNGTRLEHSVSFSHEGDIFYLVTMDRDPEVPVLIYSSNVFRYEER